MYLYLLPAIFMLLNITKNETNIFLLGCEIIDLLVFALFSFSVLFNNNAITAFYNVENFVQKF